MVKELLVLIMMVLVVMYRVTAAAAWCVDLLPASTS